MEVTDKESYHWPYWMAGCLYKTNKITCAPREDSDQPGQAPSLIGVFTVRMKKDWVFSYLLTLSNWADAQADLRLRWAHKSSCWFCHTQAKIFPSSVSFRHRVFCIYMYTCSFERLTNTVLLHSQRNRFPQKISRLFGVGNSFWYIRNEAWQNQKNHLRLVTTQISLCSGYQSLRFARNG